ncbi:MAG TPA: preprotein translocase subunit YajC [Jiangellaceae bacterium]
MDAASLLLPVLLIAVFYFLLIRPQQKQRRQMTELQQSITPGTRVMTGAGLLGTVVSIDDDEVELEVAPGVTNRYVRRAIVNVVPERGAAQPGPDHEAIDTSTTPDAPATDVDGATGPASPPKEDGTNGDDTKN